MLQKLMIVIMVAVLLFSYALPALASADIYSEPQLYEPVETTCDQAVITASYDPDTDKTHYVLSLKEGASFPNGTQLTIDDLLFSLYYYLDPAYSEATPLSAIAIEGLENYRAQYSAETHASMLALMSAIHDAGAEHVWSESDGWTAEQQQRFNALQAEYLAACEAEYPNCAQAIVDYCAEQLRELPQDALGYPGAEILESDGLKIAYAMCQWGYARFDSARGLIGTKTMTVWDLTNELQRPELADFVGELKAVYGNDLNKCWLIESPGGHSFTLPDVEGEFLRAFAHGRDVVATISGIQKLDERTLEIVLNGPDLTCANQLFGITVLPLETYGDASLWAPAEGLYGHPRGDLTAITAKLAEGEPTTLQMLDPTVEENFWGSFSFE